ncbi:MAG: hypothetical protein RXQ94_06690 [Caldivirga sp.]
MSETPINLTTSATIIGLAKRPGMTKDGRAVFSLNVEVDGNQYELNLVTKPGQGIQQALEYLASKGYLKKDNENQYLLLIPTWSLSKAKNGVIWLHIEDIEKLVGT